MLILKYNLTMMRKGHNSDELKRAITLMDMEKFEETKGKIRSRNSKKERQHNGQKKKDKWTNNDLKNITQKTKD